MDFQNFQNSNFVGGKLLKIRLSINHPWGRVMSHTKFGPDNFSRFDIYWIQTDKQSIYRYNFICVYHCIICSFFSYYLLHFLDVKKKQDLIISHPSVLITTLSIVFTPCHVLGARGVKVYHCSTHFYLIFITTQPDPNHP